MFTHADGSPWRASNQHRRPIREACGHAEINPPVSFHILRHCCASLLTNGVPLQVVASALGHADARMTEKH
jgi:site-specific recombinase XerD